MPIDIDESCVADATQSSDPPKFAPIDPNAFAKNSMYRLSNLFKYCLDAFFDQS